MPSRWFGLLIVLFWVGTTALLFIKEIYPVLGPDRPPPFTIDLTDEIHHQVTETRWSVFLEKESTGGVSQPPDNHATAKTSVEYREKPDDSFTFTVNLSCRSQPGGGLQLGLVTLVYMKSSYRINRSLQLLGMEAEFGFILPILGTNVIVAEVTGEVEEETFHSRCSARYLGGEKSINLEPVPITYHGSVLMPMHPVNRIKDLRPGQQWRMPMVNPLADAASATLSAMGLPVFKNEVRSLNVRVLPETQMLRDPDDFVLTAKSLQALSADGVDRAVTSKLEPLKDKDYPSKAMFIKGLEEVLSREELDLDQKKVLKHAGRLIPCLIIEYDHKAMKPRTWVQESNGLVLRQEATLLTGARLIMQRETIAREPEPN
jgi:hypothetical protein